MNIFGKIKAAFKANNPHMAIMSPMLDIFGWSPESDSKKLLSRVKGWSYACASRNISACSQVPMRLYQQAGGKISTSKTESIPSLKRHDFLRGKLANAISGKVELEEIVEHPLLDILRAVNPSQNGYDLKAMTFGYLESLGRAFWLKERGVDDTIVNIWPLLAQNVKIIPDSNTGGIKYYEYGSGKKKRKFRVEDIVFFRNVSLESQFDGSSPVKAGIQAIDLHDYANRFELASFKNGGRPSVVMKVPVDGFIDKEDRKRIESEFKTKYSGVENNGKFMTLTGGADLQEFGFSPKEMSFLQGRKSVLEEICGVYGVPMSFVKIQDVSRANAWAALDLYSQYTINPRLTQFEQKLNEQFTPDFGEGLYLLFDDARPKDREFRLREMKTHVETKYSNINEERAVDGLEPVEWGNTPIEPAKPDMGEAVDEKPDDKATKAAGPTNNPPKADFVPTIFLTQLVILFKELEAEIVRNLTTKAYEKAVEGDLMAAIFDTEKWEGKLEETSMPFIKGIMVQATVDSLEKISEEAVFSASSPEVVAALDDRRGQIKTIIGTTESNVRMAIKEGIENGENRGELIKRVRGVVDSRSIADRIVRTESIWAHNEGNMQGWKQSGVVKAKQWDTAEDGRRCPFCATMHGKIVPLDTSYFAKGDTLEVPVEGDPTKTQKLSFGYGEIKHPPLHPQCRCSLIPIIED